MSYWWEGSSGEKYWVEITKRRDIGADLKCPQTNDTGFDYWSYSLIQSIWPGDIVFHYSTRRQLFTGASVAGGPLEERPIIWTPHGTSGRKKQKNKEKNETFRPGWWLPLYGYIESRNPLKLSEVQEPGEQAWFLAWLAEMKEKFNNGNIAPPFQPYPERIRGQQGYLAKMPSIFLQRWPKLQALVESLAYDEEQLIRISDTNPPRSSLLSNASFKPKSDEEYSAMILGGIQRRSRNHERLVKHTAEFLASQGGVVSNPHPLDLLMISPLKMIFEAKLVSSLNPGFAIREALGQLFEYRYFIGPKDASICILLDKEPGEPLITYVEDALCVQIMWFDGARFGAGPKTRSQLNQAGVAIRTD